MEHVISRRRKTSRWKKMNKIFWIILRVIGMYFFIQFVRVLTWTCIWLCCLTVIGFAVTVQSMWIKLVQLLKTNKRSRFYINWFSKNPKIFQVRQFWAPEYKIERIRNINIIEFFSIWLNRVVKSSAKTPYDS